VLTVSAVCRPSLAGLGAELAPAAMRRLAQATIQAFTTHIATAIMDPDAWPGARHEKIGTGMAQAWPGNPPGRRAGMSS